MEHGQLSLINLPGDCDTSAVNVSGDTCAHTTLLPIVG